MELKRPSRREGMISYLLGQQLGAAISRPIPSAQIGHDSSAGSTDSVTRPIDPARAAFDSLSDAELSLLVEKKRKEGLEIEEAVKLQEARVLKAKHESDDRALFFNQPVANADFRYWSRMACWSLDEAIALSLGKDPKLVYGASFSEARDWQAIERSPFPAEYERRSELARRAHSMHQLFDPVQPADFLTWANYAFDSLPPALLAEVAVPIPTEASVRELKARIAELESVLAERAGSANQTWPWGLHETELLRKLRAAAVRFWVNYDVSDASTAPTNDQVVAWLEDQRVSTNISKAIATILRADGIAPGPRK